MTTRPCTTCGRPLKMSKREAANIDAGSNLQCPQCYNAAPPIHTQILTMLKDHDLLGSGEIARALHQSQKLILTHLSILERDNRVTHKAGSWRLKPNV